MKKKNRKQETTKIQIIIDTPDGILTYKCSNVQVHCDLQKHIEELKFAPWSIESFMIETKAPTFTLTVQPLGLKLTSKEKDWFTLEVRKK